MEHLTITRIKESYNRKLRMSEPRGETMFWKIYFWFFYCHSTIRICYRRLGWNMELHWFVNIGWSISWTFLYAYKKGFLNSAFRKVYFFLLIIWDFTYNFVIEPRVSSTNFNPIILIGFLFVISIYIALYLYAFRFFKENESASYEHGQRLKQDWKNRWKFSYLPVP